MRNNGLGEFVFTAAIAATLAVTSAANGQIVISQIFGGSGTNAQAANGDFIEVFNRSCVTVNLDGYSVQVATSATSGTPTWRVVPLPNFPLSPGQYYCVRLSTATVGTAFTQDLNGVAAVGDVLLSTSGKAAIVLGDTALTAACPPAASVVDFVVYAGTAGVCTEGNRITTVTGGATAARAASRGPDVNADGVGDGCQDTNDNAADFLVDADPAMPRTATSTFNVCPGAAVYGGCELPAGGCRAVAGAGACATLGGNYLGDCQPCPTPQACCLPTNPVTCVLTDSVSCQVDGGVFNEGQFVCPPTPACPALGRCCDPNGGCQLNFQALCVAPNTFGGVGTTCTGTPCQGACCDLQGNCNLTGTDNCAGAFGGIGTTCGPLTCTGACCTQDATCVQTGPANCIAPDVFAGIGSSCVTTLCSGRCCAADGSCTITAPGNCVGTYTLGLTCDPVDVYTFNPNLVIQDDPAPFTVTDVQTVTASSIILDLDVDLQVIHTWPGDVVIELEHLSTVVTIYDRPGVPASTFGCDVDNFDIILDDEGAGGPIETVCNATPPSAQSPPNFQPANPLSAFDGLDVQGDWTIRVTDFFTADTGTLLRWSLHVSRAGQACQAAGCACRGDVNGDTVVNGKDIRGFAACVVSGGAGCTCADVNNSGAANAADVGPFVAAVLAGACAP